NLLLSVDRIFNFFLFFFWFGWMCYSSVPLQVCWVVQHGSKLVLDLLGFNGVAWRKRELVEDGGVLVHQRCVAPYCIRCSGAMDLVVSEVGSLCSDFVQTFCLSNHPQCGLACDLPECGFLWVYISSRDGNSHP